MKDVDFPHSNLLNLQKITKPPDPKRKSVPVTKKEASHSFSTFEIEKSFVPPPKSIINEALRPEIDNLKQFLRRKRENEKRLKEMLAEGLISREELNSEPKEKVKQEEVKEKVKIDESGQARDESDNLLYVKNRTTELLINQKKEQDAQLKALKGKQKVKHTIKISRNLLDRNLFVSTSKKRLRRSLLGLQFLEQGSYQAVDTKTETKKKIENLADVFEEEEVRVIKRRNKVSLQSTREAFPIEWWDAQLLKVTSYAELKEQMSNGKSVLDFIDLNSISDLVQYQRVGAEDQKDQRIIMPMYLTKDQRKKLKRKRKREKLQEKNDKIKLGLIDPQKPKLSVGNMAIVLKDEFIIDPSRVQSQAKKQTEQRLNKHLQTNSLRKLTKAQRRDKSIRKLKRDSAKECRRLVCSIKRLQDPGHIFKLNMNAKQLALNGLVIRPTGSSNQPAVIVAEGGAKAIKFFKNLLQNRIRWSEESTGNRCNVIWEGIINNSTAGKWRTYEAADEVEAIRVLTEKKLEHFWDYVSNE